MNVTNRIMTNEDCRKKYFEELDELNVKKETFISFTKQTKEAAKKKEKAESKKQRRSGVIVNGATRKEDIQRIKRILRQRIAEIVAGEDDEKLKSLMVRGLQNKLDALDRIYGEIERREREPREKRRRKQNNNKTEAVYLNSNDLTVNKNGAVNAGASETWARSDMTFSDSIELTAGFDTVINTSEITHSFDVQA